MKAVSLILLLACFIAACAPKQIPRQELANLPPYPEPKEKRKEGSAEKTMSSSPSAKYWEGFRDGALVGAGGVALIGFAAGKMQRGNCGDCGGDGFVHAGDRRAAIIFHQVHACPLCGGDGHL